MLHIARGTCIVRQDITLRGASATKGDLMTMETQHAPRSAEVGPAYLDRLERLLGGVWRPGGGAREADAAGRPGAESACRQPGCRCPGGGHLRRALPGRRLVVLVVVGRADRD